MYWDGINGAHLCSPLDGCAHSYKMIYYSIGIIVGNFACIFYSNNFSSFQAADFCSLHRGVSGSTFYRSDIPFHHSSACWCADHFPLWTLSKCTIISRKWMFKKWSSPMAFLLCVNSWRNIFGWASWVHNLLVFHVGVNMLRISSPWFIAK